MARFILVHGAWHGGWCWEEIVPRLEAAGHAVLAPDLPGMEPGATGENPASLEDWARFIADLARAGEPAVLAGHSRGGIVISRAAELAPEAVARLVYVTAILAAPGDSLVDTVMRTRGGEPLPPNPAVAVAADGRTTRFTDPAIGAAMFYGECAPETARAAFARFAPEPTSAMVTPLELTAENYGRLPRTYIECLRDQALPIATQRAMHARQPCAVATIDTDHSPFYSAPDELAAILLDVAP